MFKRVIIPVDFSETSRSAFDLAALVAPHASFELLHVVEPLDIAEPPVWAGEAPAAAQLREHAIADARDTMMRFADRPSVLPSPPRAEVLVGPLPDTIVEYAKHMDGDLLCLTTHGRSGVSRWIMGSVAERLARVAPCPMLVTRMPPVTQRLERIVVGVDLSEHSKRALSLAGRLCQAHGAGLDIVYAWTHPYAGAPASGYADLIAAVGLEAKRHLVEFVRSAELPPGLSVRQLTPCGEPAAVLHDTLAEGPSDLVVLGTHGRRGFRHFVLGSVAETTLRHAPCATLIVP